MIRAVVGTAGHIDHGKTALVRALTGTDTDRLAEERARGITIDLGFAEIPAEGPEGVALGVVDVPGHENFVRTMVAGASGMDLALLVVAADEGVMPQTREHLAILHFLEVPGMVVALTKTDLVEPAWLELVEEEVRETLAGTSFAEAPFVGVSAETGKGLPALREALLAGVGSGARAREADLLRLPVDRSFTVRGTGTVVTGTLWSGVVEEGQDLYVLPDGLQARVRGLQLHGSEVERAVAGSRTAVALVGPEIHPDRVGRGSTLVAGDWPLSSILTVRVQLLEDTGWRLEHNQRVHLHLGTQEVRARCALLRPADVLDPGGTGWLQLRTEAPVVARAGDRVVLRSFSPVTTIAGGVVAEPLAPKRRRWSPEVGGHLEALVDGSAAEAVAAALELAGWGGVEVDRLPVLAGLGPTGIGAVLADRAQDEDPQGSRDVAFGVQVRCSADALLLERLEALHRERPLRSVVALADLRSGLPEWAHPLLADLRLQALEERGDLVLEEGGARRVGWTVSVTPEQERMLDQLRDIYREAGLQPPERADLPGHVAGKGAPLDPLLAYLEAQKELVSLTADLWIDREALEAGIQAVRQELAGQTGLGPADFRAALPVTRKHLIPLLGYLDGVGVTHRTGEGRSVVA